MLYLHLVKRKHCFSVIMKVLKQTSGLKLVNLVVAEAAFIMSIFFFQGIFYVHHYRVFDFSFQDYF